MRFSDDFVGVDVEEVVGVRGLQKHGGIGASVCPCDSYDVGIQGDGAGIRCHDGYLETHHYTGGKEAKNPSNYFSERRNVRRH